MSLTDKKVSDALLQTGVVSAPDRLTGTAAENKAVFDRLMRNVAQSVINPVIDELVGIEGADNIGTPEGSVRQRLDSASDHIGNRENPHNVTSAQIGAETPMEAQNKANEALSQAKQYAETEIRKHIAQSGAVIADGKGNAENANALNGVPGENYLPEKITDLTGAKSYEYAAPMACVARPSFTGRTVQEGTPGPDSPAPIKGVLNPWVAAYSGGLVEVPAGVEPLMALPDGTADRIVLRDGIWRIERVYKWVEFTGDEPWIAEITNDPQQTVGFHINLSDAQGTPNGNIAPIAICNSFKAYSPNQNYGLRDISFSINHIKDCWFKLPEIGTLDAWKLFLSEKKATGNSIKMCYKLEAPVFEPVPAWNGLGKIEPIAVTTTIAKPDPDAPISPDNMATITGTPAVATGYRGKVKQLTGELFDGDSFDGVNLVQTVKDWKITRDSCKWHTTFWAESPETIAFYANLPMDFNTSPTVVMCDRFTLWGANDTETIQAQGNNGYVYLFIKKSRLSDSFDTLVENEKVAALENWLDANPVHLLYELNTPVITRHNLDLALSPGAYTIEAGDENGLLESVSIEVLPDSAVYGRRVYPYQHIKEGTVHKLTGTPGAEQIIFNATDVYQDGDTWTLNGAAVSVTYNDGQTLLPTAVIAGDVVEAVIEGGVLRLMLQKPTPQKNLLDNANFRNPVNQRGLATYTGRGYTIDRWLLWRAETFITVRGDCIELSPTGSVGLCALTQRPGSQTTYAGTYTLTAEVEGHVGLDYFDLDTGSRSIHAGVSGKRSVISVTYHIDHDVEKRDNRYSILNPSTTESVKIYRIKLEPGPRFTGWYEPKPGETLAECQRYFLPLPQYSLWRATQVTGNFIDFTIPLTVQMRTKPAIVLPEGSALFVRKLSGEIINGFSFSVQVNGPLGLRLRAQKTAHGMTDAVLEAGGGFLDANFSLFDPIYKEEPTERTKHYITTDKAGRILSGWSDGAFPDKDNTGAIMLTDQGGYQFRLEPGEEENPVLANPDGTHRYIYDPSLTPAYREATAEELATERAEIEAARVPPAAETERLDMIQEIVEMRAQLAQLQINGGM